MKAYEWDCYRIRVSECGERRWYIKSTDSFCNPYWSMCESCDDDLLDALFRDGEVTLIPVDAGVSE